MTAINLAMAGKPLTSANKSELADRITEAFAHVEVGNDAPQIRGGFMIKFEHLEEDDLWIGTETALHQSPSNRAALITIRVMAGPWNNEMKAELFERIESVLREVAEMPKEGKGSDIWMTFLEVPEGSWGLGGRAVSIAALAPVFTSDRQTRIRTYLDAEQDSSGKT